jgi:dTDP-4-dehydrorhamnose reductase
MILLLGASGYIGEAFVSELKARKLEFEPVSRGAVDYTDFPALLNMLKTRKPDFVINAAGYTGKPNVDACELAKADTLMGNALLPETVGQACTATGTPWGHVSSGCIFTGAKIENSNSKLQTSGKLQTSSSQALSIEKDLTRRDLSELVEKSPDLVHGYTEMDEPNFSFRSPPCSFYSGAKALGEEAIQNLPRTYIWRPRIPFDELDNGRNYLSKVQRYAKVYDNVNSISHRGDFAGACLDLWQKKSPFGTYNVTNPGFVTTRQVIEMIERILKPARKFEFWASNDEFYRQAAKTPRSNCVMDVTKLLSAGIRIRPVEEALESSLKNWKPEPTDH